MDSFAKSAAALLALACVLSGCNRSPAATDDPATAAMAAPVDYPPAEKAQIQAAFPAPYNTADLAAGKKQFNKCRACHTIAPNGMNMTGPHLYGLFGRHAGTASDYTYSDAMKAHNVVWDFNTLDIYLNAPQLVVKGTKMSYPGIQNETDRHNLIAYLALETTPRDDVKSSATGSQ